MHQNFERLKNLVHDRKIDLESLDWCDYTDESIIDMPLQEQMSRLNKCRAMTHLPEDFAHSLAIETDARR